MSTETIDDITQILNNDDLNFTNTDNHQPWTTVIRGKSTCTANIYNIQKNHTNLIQYKICINTISNVATHGNILLGTPNGKQ